MSLGVVLAILLIAVVSELTGGNVTTNDGQAISPLVGTTLKSINAVGVSSATVTSPWSSGRPTVMLFFGSWCSICHTEMPKVVKYLHGHDVSPVSVFGDDNNEPLSDAKAFVKKLGVTFPVASDPNNDISVGIFDFTSGDPETVFINRKGVVKNVHLGPISIKELRRGIASLKST